MITQSAIISVSRGIDKHILLNHNEKKPTEPDIRASNISLRSAFLCPCLRNVFTFERQSREYVDDFPLSWF